MSHWKEYDNDGQLFSVKFPIKLIETEAESKFVSYTDQNGTYERSFSTHSEFIKFIQWLDGQNT